jgi:hypothetical protein
VADPHAAYKEWRDGLRHSGEPTPEAAYVAGFKFACWLQEESQRSDNPVVRNLKRISEDCGFGPLA